MCQKFPRWLASIHRRVMTNAFGYISVLSSSRLLFTDAKMSQSTIQHILAPSILTPLQFILIVVQEQSNVEMTRNDVEMNYFIFIERGIINKEFQNTILKGGSFEGLLILTLAIVRPSILNAKSEFNRSDRRINVIENRAHVV